MHGMGRVLLIRIQTPFHVPQAGDCNCVAWFMMGTYALCGMCVITQIQTLGTMQTASHVLLGGRLRLIPSATPSSMRQCAPSPPSTQTHICSPQVCLCPGLLLLDPHLLASGML
jgi:hypothetical protein